MCGGSAGEPEYIYYSVIPYSEPPMSDPFADYEPVRKEFSERWELFWIHDAENWQLDDELPISRRSYAAVKGPETCLVDLL